jgi:ribosomal protein L16 Arg81 hydroxylase
MTRRFLDNLSLATLVAPVSEEDFRASYFEQKPLVVRRRDPNYYGDLFSVRDFDEAITRGPDYVKIANATTKKNAQYKADMTPGLEATLADMRDGGTLVLDQLHNREPKLGLLCRVLAEEIGHMFQTNLYLTPPHGKGFAPHWDNHDVFILQVVGSKHWHVEKERRTFPRQKETMGEEGRELRGDLLSFTIEQGDVIYIPRGFVHAAECGSEPSLHITLGLTAFFLEDLLHAAITAAVRRDERLRAALPLGFLRGGPDCLAKSAVAALGGIADGPFLNAVVDQYRNELVAKFRLDTSGQVVNFLRPVPLALGDSVGPRRGIVYRTHAEEDSVRLHFGGRTITFASFFKEPLDFALTRASYAIRDIAGELEDEEKLVFIERLMQEGLVIRNADR